MAEQFDAVESPKQIEGEVIVAHRFGYWMTDDPNAIDSAMIEEADAYLEAHIQWRIAQATNG
jgi:hypothetical protein